METTKNKPKRTRRPRKKKLTEKLEKLTLTETSNSKQPKSRRSGAQRRVQMMGAGGTVVPSASNSNGCNPRSAGMITPRDNPVSAYVRCMCFPTSAPCRIPDAKPVKSCLWTSKQVYDVYADLTPESGNGRFSACLQPKIGKTTTDPRNYKVALVDSAIGDWGTYDPQKWSSTDPYIKSQGGETIPIDQYAHTMTQPTIQTSLIVGGGTMGGTNIFGTLPAQSVALSSRPPPVAIKAGTPSLFLVNAGLYDINVHYTGTTLDAASLVLNVVTGDITVINWTHSGSSDDTLNVARFSVDVKANSSFYFSNGSAGSITGAGMNISTANFGNHGWYMNAGLTTSVRPVSMTAMFTSVVPDMFNGGSVVGALVPADLAKEQYFNSAVQTSGGQFQMWESLAKYTGNTYKVKDGVHVTWSPQDNRDSIFQDPESSLSTEYPAIIISGQAIFGTAATGKQLVGRIITENVWEFMSPCLLFQQGVAMGSQAIVDASLQCMATCPKVCENPRHEEVLTKTVGQAFEFAKTIAPFVLPLVASVF